MKRSRTSCSSARCACTRTTRSCKSESRPAAFPRASASRAMAPSCQVERAAFALIASLGLVACGGGMPLLHPAHTLKTGQVSGAVGASGHFLLGDADDAIERTDAAGASNSLGAEG